MEKWWNYTMKRKKRNLEKGSRQADILGTGWITGSDFFFKGSDEDSAEVEDRTGYRYGN